MVARQLNRILMAALALLGIGLLASVYGANSMLASKSSALVTSKAASLAAKDQETQLAQAKKDIAAYGGLNEIAKSVVPQDKDQAKAVSEIVNLASQSGISRLSSVSFPPSTLGSLPAGKTAKGFTQLTPVKGMAGVYTLQITVTQADSDPVPYSSFVNFLSKLERDRRTALVNSISVQPNADRPDRVSFTLIIDEYIQP